MSKHLVFVYGSLRRGSAGEMSIRFPAAKFVAEGRVSGRLYDLGAYPGLLLDETDSLVTGEVYEVDNDTLDKLDEFEASDSYVRKEVEASLGNQTTRCWVYVPEYDSDSYSHHALIMSGDWVQYLKRRQAMTSEL